ncbi:hypothetical protein ACFWDG_21610 [Peribacillus sp. NPDC060186]
MRPTPCLLEREAEAAPDAPLFSVVMITFARDSVAQAAIAHVRAAVGTREDIATKQSISFEDDNFISELEVTTKFHMKPCKYSIWNNIGR